MEGMRQRVFRNKVRSCFGGLDGLGLKDYDDVSDSEGQEWKCIKVIGQVFLGIVEFVTGYKYF